jgi:hypothetical protein
MLRKDLLTCFQFGLLSHVSNDIVKCLRCNRAPPLSPYQLVQKLLYDLPAQQRQRVLKDSILFCIQYAYHIRMNLNIMSNFRQASKKEWMNENIYILSFSCHMVASTLTTKLPFCVSCKYSFMFNRSSNSEVPLTLSAAWYGLTQTTCSLDTKAIWNTHNWLRTQELTELDKKSGNRWVEMAKGCKQWFMPQDTCGKG